MTEIMTWNYAGEADITYGEVHVSPVAKILLAISLIFIVVSAVSAVAFKDYIYDFIVNPRIVFNDQVKVGYTNDSRMYYYYDLSYEPPDKSSEFDLTTLIDTNTYKDEYEFNKEDDIIGHVDRSEIGKYKIIYRSKNRVNSNEIALIVYVKDTTAPEIKFKPNSNLLVRGADNEHIPGTDSYKTPKDFINGGINDDYDGEITDIKNINVYDCSDGTDIEIPYEGLIDYGREGIITKILKYKVTDKAGNMCTETLTITIVDNYEEDLNELARLKSSMNTNNNLSNGNSGSGNKSNTDTPGTATPGTATLDGHITWSMQYGDMDAFFAMLSTMSIGGGSAEVVSGPGIDQQYEPGEYTVTWKASDGSTVSQLVTITE